MCVCVKGGVVETQTDDGMRRRRQSANINKPSQPTNKQLPNPNTHTHTYLRRRRRPLAAGGGEAHAGGADFGAGREAGGAVRPAFRTRECTLVAVADAAVGCGLGCGGLWWVRGGVRWDGVVVVVGFVVAYNLGRVLERERGRTTNTIGGRKCITKCFSILLRSFSRIISNTNPLTHRGFPCSSSEASASIPSSGCPSGPSRPVS